MFLTRNESLVSLVHDIDASQHFSIRHMQAIPSAPSASQEHLRTLAQLHGVSSIEQEAAFFYSSGALPLGSQPRLREAQLQLCSQLASGGGAALLELCDGFGIPDHCIQAPIAFDWHHL
jgi:acyl-CoA oxidase